MSFIYQLKNNNIEESKKTKANLGNKGFNILKMIEMGFNVPEAFVISSEICQKINSDRSVLNNLLNIDLINELKKFEQEIQKDFIDQDSDNFILLSVRSGACVSMPGMMDTVLNIGMTKKRFEKIYKKDPIFAIDTYKRFISYYSSTILDYFNIDIDDILRKNSNDLTPEMLYDVIEKINESSPKKIPIDDPLQQLKDAIECVFDSWNSERALHYRKINNISQDIGTAVIVQRMIFGNLSNNSSTGVIFTRNPLYGGKDFVCEYIQNAQGEDIVSGKHNPVIMDSSYKFFDDIKKLSNDLEAKFKFPQDIEFTIEDGNLFVLQTRNLKMAPMCSLQIAYEMHQEGLLTKKEAIKMLNANDITSLLHKSTVVVDSQVKISKGMPASPGCISGLLALSSEIAIKLHHDFPDDNIILCTQETTPDDIHGIHAASGVLTAMGGLTSHAAVIARGMGKVSVVGASEISINLKDKYIEASDIKIKEGDYITIDGSKGDIYTGKGISEDKPFPHILCEVLKWSKEINDIKINVNADTADECKLAKTFGVSGVGLCRTEHMFMESDRMKVIRSLILSSSIASIDEKIINNLTNKLYKAQINDFVEIYNVMEELPVKIRLLDMPLHEFIPNSEKEIESISVSLSIDSKIAASAFNNLREKNPMLGFRGCRFGIVNDKIYEAQILAILHAAHEVSKQKNIEIVPHIMIPLVFEKKEVLIIKEKILDLLNRFNYDCSIKMKCKIGMMLELPGSILSIDEFKDIVDFFSIGTNDLTQTVLGISRDDMGIYLKKYQDKGLIASNPFEEIDTRVLKIIKMAVDNLNHGTDISICGEHGGNQKSIYDLYDNGIRSFSCSVYRIPIAIISSINKLS